MKRFSFNALMVVTLGGLLTACSSGAKYADLDEFMAEKRAAPSGKIDPIPVMKAYRAFNYSASGLRSPFSKPVDVKEIARLEASVNVKPDTDREKEFLEQFSFESLKMVGSLELSGTLWALIKDPDGGVHRIRVGNHLGRNYGRVTELKETYLSVVEVVSTGGDGWVERPRSLEIQAGK